eukprot:TRINITY_DN658_c0_g1_i2.p1 TRINITY_DN658_c0_g1~~TRINITY_DN658_c0_g1_i2.p1  ORF type:complete len:459 (+),score=138.24 TRINITY_DN658_c0_g1_i2:106-1377(+)
MAGFSSEIRALAALRKENALTTQEYEEAKAALLRQLKAGALPPVSPDKVEDLRSRDGGGAAAQLVEEETSDESTSDDTSEDGDDPKVELRAEDFGSDPELVPTVEKALRERTPDSVQAMLRCFGRLRGDRASVVPVQVTHREIEDEGKTLWTGKVCARSIFALAPGQLALSIRVQYGHKRKIRYVYDYVKLDSFFQIDEHVRRRRCPPDHLHARLNAKLQQTQREQPCSRSGKSGKRPPRETASPTPDSTASPTPEKAAEQDRSVGNPYYRVLLSHDGSFQMGYTAKGCPSLPELAKVLGQVMAEAAGKPATARTVARVLDLMLIHDANADSWSKLRSEAQLHPGAWVHAGFSPASVRTIQGTQRKRGHDGDAGEDGPAGAGNVEQRKRQRRDSTPAAAAGLGSRLAAYFLRLAPDKSEEATE